MVRALLVVVALGAASCTAPLERPAAAPPATYNCASLDAEHRTWGGVAKFAGGLSASGALATLPISEDQKTLRLSVAIGAALMGALAATGVYVEQDAAATWAKECTGP